MALRLDDLRDAVVDQLGLLELDHMLTTDTLNRSINTGLRRMTREMDWPWLQVYSTIPLVAGTDTYALPTNVVRIVRASLDGDAITSSEPVDMLNYFDISATPERFVVEGGNIRIGPKPVIAGTLKYVYIRPEPKLVNDADVVLAPDQYEDVIVTYAAIHQATRLKDLQLVNALDAVREQSLRAIRRDVIKTSKLPPIKTRNDI